MVGADRTFEFGHDVCVQALNSFVSQDFTYFSFWRVLS